jgi:hypothetical protein
MKQMSIQSIKIKIGNETKELTIKEARELKDALDDLFPQRMPQCIGTTEDDSESLRKTVSELRAELANKEKNYRDLAQHHNTHCTCMEIY